MASEEHEPPPTVGIVNPGTSPSHEIHDSCDIPKPKRCFIPTRLVLVLLIFLSHFNIYGMRVNLSLALVAMVKENSTDVHQHYSYCKGLQNDTHRKDEAGQFDWNVDVQSAILSSFYYGYLVTQLPGSCTSIYLSAKWTLGLSVLFSAVLSLLTPLAANHGYITLIANRVAIGMVQGVYFPASFTLLGLWLPPEERSFGFSFVSAGSGAGSTVYLFLSGILASSNIMHGWPSIFYFSGIAGILWCLFWFPLAYDSPSSHPWIRESEQKYIMESLEWDRRAISIFNVKQRFKISVVCDLYLANLAFLHVVTIWFAPTLYDIKFNFYKVYTPKQKKQKPRKVPWASLLLSLPVWAAIICQVCREFGFFIFLSETPTYFSDILGFDLSQSGFLSGIPWIMQLFLGIGAGFFGDLIIRRKYATVGIVRKAFTVIAMVFQATLFIITAYSNCNTTVAAVCFVTAIAFGGLYLPGYMVNKLDIAPNSVSVISAIVNILATVGAILGPLLVGLITGEEGTTNEWKLVFWIIVITLCLGVFVYVALGSGDHQPWDKELTESSSAQDDDGGDNDDNDVGDTDSSSSPLLKGEEID